MGEKKRVCPTCQSPLKPTTEARFLPFCRARCKDADLGRWFEGSYRFSRPANPFDSDVPVATDET